jgi:hypothetical protein
MSGKRHLKGYLILRGCLDRRDAKIPLHAQLGKLCHCMLSWAKFHCISSQAGMLEHT